jgi:hypothetical protein
MIDPLIFICDLHCLNDRHKEGQKDEATLNEKLASSGGFAADFLVWPSPYKVIHKCIANHNLANHNIDNRDSIAYKKKCYIGS